MKLFSQKGRPVETAPSGTDGSKLPVVKSLSPGVIPIAEVPAALDALRDDLAKKYVPTDLPGGHGVGSVRHGGVNPRVDLSQYIEVHDIPQQHPDNIPRQHPDNTPQQYRVPVNRPVKFEQGEILIIEGCKFKIVFIRSNPSRMTLEAV